VSKGWLYGLNKLQQLSLAYNKVNTFSTMKLKLRIRIPDPGSSYKKRRGKNVRNAQK
jgi:hypothetical protein